MNDDAYSLLSAALQTIRNDYGVLVKRIDVQWLNLSDMEGPHHVVSGLRVDADLYPVLKAEDIQTEGA